MRGLPGLARLLMAPVFVIGGWSTLREPEPRAELAEPVLDAVEQVVPESVQPRRTTLVRANAVAQILGGLALPFDALAGPASGLLALTLVPATLGGHRFWEETEPEQRAEQEFHLLKNLAILGGLLLGARE
jgi:putative oxidoreductase